MPSSLENKRALTTVLLYAVTMALGVPLHAAGQAGEKILYSFRSDGSDGFYPQASLIADRAGNLYGTTEGGGTDGDGTVFQLVREPNGEWHEKILYSFSGSDGSTPVGGLIFDDESNLYGTTNLGGAYGCGAVFELTPSSNDQWSENVLYSFSGPDGCEPRGGVILDAAGNLYGTTSIGGSGYADSGTAFELVRGANNEWTERVLYSFSGGFDGMYPQSGLISDPEGNLFGTTGAGGGHGAGTVFVLFREPNEMWTENIVHAFTYDDLGKGGTDPWAALVFDKAGNLYGTTVQGGFFSTGCLGFGCGIVFKLKRPMNRGNTWVEEIILHSFGGLDDGVAPYGSLIVDAANNLYGTASGGGVNGSTCSSSEGCGVVFQLTPSSDGAWDETILHSFQNNGEDGYGPRGGLLFDKKGNLYGTTDGGGAYGSTCPNDFGCGTVFEIVR